MRVTNINLVLFVSIFFCVCGDNNVVYNQHSLELTQSMNLARQELIQERCNRYHLKWSHNDLPYNKLEHILIDDDRKLLYCYVPKVACTNWKRLLMILSGKWNGTDVLAIPGHLAHSPGMFRNLSSVPKEEREEMLENYHKMIIVRNPFERLLSAYRNKLEIDSPTATYFRNRLGRAIIKAFRANPSNESLELGNDVTFREFALFLTTKTEPPAESTNMVNNEHWQPITNLCHPCFIKYTLVGKYETLLDDSELALNTINATDEVHFPRLKHTSETSEKLSKYFSQLELPLIRKLYKIYKYDFSIFGYDLNNIMGFDLG